MHKPPLACLAGAAPFLPMFASGLHPAHPVLVTCLLPGRRGPQRLVDQKCSCFGSRGRPQSCTTEPCCEVEEAARCQRFGVGRRTFRRANPGWSHTFQLFCHVLQLHFMSLVVSAGLLGLDVLTSPLYGLGCRLMCSVTLQVGQSSFPDVL